ncbi:MAG: hypothetical protein JST85_23860 [Acidobacteria bacterium]|nr:hypothetical protein [Acidobacteriota bacterium]
MNFSNTTSNSENQIEKTLVKRNYQKPELVLYGNISEITRTVDMSGMMDGGKGQTDKT